jgi:uncharacterized membrane protein SpoIIM required for sporulation
MADHTSGPANGAPHDELRALVDRASGRPERLGGAGVLRLGSLYRAAAAELAQLRRTRPGAPATAELDALVVRARQLVYLDHTRSASLREFVSHGYWRRICERPALLALAAALLFVPLLLAGFWAAGDPAAALGLVPEQFRPAAEPGSGVSSLSASDSAGLAGEIYTNNIRVALLEVAGGVPAGLGTAALAIYNGTFIGALGGIVIAGGDAEAFFALVVPHGVLELSLIVVAALAGLRIGAAVVDPGRLPRLVALRAEGRAAAELVLGTAPWLVLAGLVEGFVTGNLGGLAPALVVGVALGVLFWGLVLWRGRTAAPVGS